MHKIPDSYFKGNTLATYILLIPLYAFFFLIGAKPYHLDTFMQVTQDQLAFRAAIMASIEIVVTLISRLSMLLVRSKHQINYTGFIIWELLEGLAIAMFCTLFVWLMDNRTMLYMELLPKLFIITFSILVFPYIIIALLAEIKDRDIRLAKDKVTIEKYATGQIGREDSTLPFLDDKKSLKLAVTANAILYIEAADNYVMIHYSAQGKLQHYMLRATLRDIEEKFQDVGLRRTHRSYIVNFSRVKLLKRTNEGLMIDFDMEGVPNIPVSKTYMDTVMEQLVNAREQEDDETLYQHFK